MKKKWYLVTYDIREPRRLRRAAKRIEGFGIRIQYSVFRCKLRPREMERLVWELSKILDAEDDLMIIGLCENCANHVHCKQGNKQWNVEQTTFEIV